MTAGWLIVATALLPAPPLLAGSGPSSALSAAAASSGRPPECVSASRRALAKGPSIWEQARLPTLQRYCDLMARAHGQLGAQPDAARGSALEADKALPGRAAPQVVIARAALQLGASEEARAAFERAQAIDPRSVEDPRAMHALAQTLARTRHHEEALDVYRALVPRIDLLGTGDERVDVLLEAAHAAMASERGDAADPAGAKKRSSQRLEEAAAYLREARQRQATMLAGEVLLSLALVLDRAGEREAADAALVEAQLAAKPRSGTPPYVASPGDDLALAALAAEGSDHAAALKAWESFLAGPGGKGPWAAAARARLDAQKRGGTLTKAAPARKAKPR